MKRNAALLILIILVLTLINISESISEGIGPISGTCGTDLTWSLQEGVLTITGTGNMSDYATNNAPPWEKRKSQITEIVIGENITTIGDYAFYYCDSLETVSLPNSLKSLGAYSFAYSSINQIELPVGLETIKNHVFFSSSLTGIQIPDSVTSLGSCVFAETKALKTAKLPSSLTSIPHATFSFATGLESIQIPNGVITIENNAFAYCSNMETVEMPASVKKIGSTAFGGYNSLKEVHYGGTQEQAALISIATNNNPLTTAKWLYSDDTYTIGVGPTSGTCGTDLTWSLEENILTITGTGAMPDFATDNAPPWENRKSQIIEIDIGENITTIGDYAFYYCDSLETVSLPNSLKSLGAYSFAYSSINQIELPAGLETIKNHVFFSSSLSGIQIPDSVTSFGNCVFAQTNLLKTAKLPSSLTSIPHATFSFATGLESIQIPNSVITIENNAFAYCRSLETIELPASVKKIGSTAFGGYSSLKEVHYGGTQEQTALISIATNNNPLTTAKWFYIDDTSTIGVGPTSGTCGIDLTWSLQEGVLTITGTGTMFDYTTDNAPPWEKRKSQITEVVIGDKVASIGDYAFYYCDSLETVSLPSTLKSLGAYSFAYTTLSQIELPVGLETIKNHVFFSSSLTGIQIPDSVTSLGSCVFAETKALKTAKLPSSLTSIPHATFSFATGLESIQIPNGIITIENNAFAYCRSLETIELPASVKKIGSTAFGGYSSLKEVHYGGTQEQAAIIDIDTDNAPLTNAKWYYKPDISKLNILRLPTGTTKIETRAFEATSCEAVIIPDTCTLIDSRAFANCPNLIFVSISGNTIIANDAFEECAENIFFEIR